MDKRMKYLHSFIVLSLLFFSQTVFSKSEIYKCLDQYGRPTYSTQKTCDNPETVGKTQRSKKDDKDFQNYTTLLV